MEKIKLLYVITSLGLGGAEKLLLSYLNKLDKSKYRYYVCCLREFPNDLSPYIAQHAQVINLRIKNKFNPLVVFNLVNVIKKIQPDIIHTHLFQPRIYTTIAKLFCKQGLLITHKHSVVNPRKHHIFLLLEMISIFLNKKVIAISNSVKQSLIKYEFIPKNKIYVLQNCIDFQKFNTDVTVRKMEHLLNKEIIIGTVGRIEKVKGIHYLIMAMKIVLDKYPMARLEIIGDGSALPELIILSEKTKISNSVFFFGKLTDPIPNYKRMDVFVLPSLLEGFGLVLLEAMASGLPVIATNVDGIREVIVDGESGILVPPKNPRAIAKAILRIIESPELTKNLVEEGIKRSKLFDLQEHIMKLDNLYNSLLREEPYQ
jgi:glycosyltransferase involved in cell wall biosynthesis